MSDTPKVLCASTSTAAGACLLPNTGNDPLLTVLSVITMAAGVVVLVSFAATRISAAKASR